MLIKRCDKTRSVFRKPFRSQNVSAAFIINIIIIWFQEIISLFSRISTHNNKHPIRMLLYLYTLHKKTNKLQRSYIYHNITWSTEIKNIWHFVTYKIIKIFIIYRYHRFIKCDFIFIVYTLSLAVYYIIILYVRYT